MQINDENTLFIKVSGICCLVATIFALSFWFDSVAAQQSPRNEGEAPIKASIRNGIPEYRIIGDDCSKDSSCYLSVFIEPQNINEIHLIQFVHSVFSTNPDRDFLSIVVFDSEKFTKKYLRGLRDPKEYILGARAVYIFDRIGRSGEKREVLRFHCRETNKVKVILSKTLGED